MQGDLLQAIDSTKLTDIAREAFTAALELDVGPDDDFFGMGGSSLGAVVVVNELQERLDMALMPTAVFSHPTARSLAVAIENGLAFDHLEYEAGHDVRAGDLGTGATQPGVPLSLVQQASLLIAPRSASRGILTWVSRLDGVLDIPALARAVDDVVRRHEVLRTRFERRGPELRQAAAPFVPGTLRIVDLTRSSMPATLTAALDDAERTYRSLSPDRTPHFQATLYTVAPRTAVLAMCVAEVIVDADSGSLLVAELVRAYTEHIGRAPDPELPSAVSDSYLDYVATHPAPTAMVGPARKHWEDQLRRVPEVSRWPLAPRDDVSRSAVALSAAEWTEVVRSAQVLRTTPEVVVLAAFQIALARLVGIDHLLVDTVVTDRSDPVTHRMIGNFQVPVRLEARLYPTDRFVDLATRALKAVQEAIGHRALPAPLADPSVHAAAAAAGATATAAVGFSMLQSRRGPRFPGLRHTPFRVSTGSARPLELHCDYVPSGPQDFLLESTTAPPDLLDRLAGALRMALETAMWEPTTPVPVIDPAATRAV